jgi:hypothetical protein
MLSGIVVFLTFSTDRHDAGSPGLGAVLDVASIAPPLSTQEITPAIHA